MSLPQTQAAIEPSGAGRMAGAAFLRSSRLSLWPLAPRDATGLLELDRSDLVARWLLDDRLKNLLQAQVLIAWMRNFYVERPGLGLWAARNANGEFVGIYSLMPVDGSDDIEIGARLLPRFWNGGLAVEMGVQMCAHAFDVLKLPRLLSFCDPRHESVPAVLRRLGFSLAGTREHFGKPALCFERLREDWEREGRLNCAASKRM